MMYFVCLQKNRGLPLPIEISSILLTEDKNNAISTIEIHRSFVQDIEHQQWYLKIYLMQAYKTIVCRLCPPTIFSVYLTFFDSCNISLIFNDSMYTPHYDDPQNGARPPNYVYLRMMFSECLRSFKTCNESQCLRTENWNIFELTDITDLYLSKTSHLISIIESNYDTWQGLWTEPLIGCEKTLNQSMQVFNNASLMFCELLSITTCHTFGHLNYYSNNDSSNDLSSNFTHEQVLSLFELLDSNLVQHYLMFPTQCRLSRQVDGEYFKIIGEIILNYKQFSNTFTNLGEFILRINYTLNETAKYEIKDMIKRRDEDN